MLDKVTIFKNWNTKSSHMFCDLLKVVIVFCFSVDDFYGAFFLPTGFLILGKLLLEYQHYGDGILKQCILFCIKVIEEVVLPWRQNTF